MAAAGPVCGHLQQIFYFIKIFYCPIERGPVPNGCFYPIPEPKAGLFYMTTLFTKTTQLVLPSSLPHRSEEVCGMNTELFSEVFICDSASEFTTKSKKRIKNFSFTLIHIIKHQLNFAASFIPLLQKTQLK